MFLSLYPSHVCWRDLGAEVAVFATQSHARSLLIVPAVVRVRLRQVGSAPIMFFKTPAHTNEH